MGHKRFKVRRGYITHDGARTWNVYRYDPHVGGLVLTGCHYTWHAAMRSVNRIINGGSVRFQRGLAWRHVHNTYIAS